MSNCFVVVVARKIRSLAYMLGGVGLVARQCQTWYWLDTDCTHKVLACCMYILCSETGGMPLLHADYYITRTSCQIPDTSHLHAHKHMYMYMATRVQ